MRPLLFACDIDNTLILSHRHSHEGWDCVEWLEGREQSFISPETARGLLSLPEEVTLALVTSRTAAQFRRLRVPGRPPLALTANGADLLTEGGPDPAWRKETEVLIEPWREELRRCFVQLQALEDGPSAAMADDAYLSAACADPAEAARWAAALQGETALEVIPSGRKVYLLPPPLNKGAAARRLMDRLGLERMIAAGDSPMDLPMLNAADVAIVPWALRQCAQPKARVCPEGRVFPEFVLKTALGAFRQWDADPP